MEDAEDASFAVRAGFIAKLPRPSPHSVRERFDKPVPRVRVPIDDALDPIQVRRIGRAIGGFRHVFQVFGRSMDGYRLFFKKKRLKTGFKLAGEGFDQGVQVHLTPSETVVFAR